MYDNKSDCYFSICRTDILALVPQKSGNRMLEVGAGTGETLLKAKASGLAHYVVGVDLTRVADSHQSHPDLDRFIIGNIENLIPELEKDSFDVIICGDVLEHLIDPWETLAGLKSLLRDGGVIIASVPNVRYWKISMGLFFKGSWSYVDSGILDRTHLRFFAKDTVQRLFSETGLRIVAMESQGPQRAWGFSAWALNLLTFGLLADLLTVQYLVVSAKKAGCR